MLSNRQAGTPASRHTPKPRRRGGRRLTLAVAVTLLGSLTASAAASAATTARRSVTATVQVGVIPPPASDPFYAVPARITALPDGTILASRPVQAMAAGVPIPARGWQVKYKTVDQHGRASAFVTTILVPDTPWTGAGARPLVSYQVAMDALSTECAPSYVLRAGATGDPNALSSNAESETGNILQTVEAGYAVAVPDFEGPDAEWIPNVGAAHGVLDGIRAARRFAPDGISSSAPIGLVGYSGGALATDWAIQAQPSYAPELHLVGAALGGTPASLPASFQDFASNPGAMAAAPLLLAAFERSYPSWNVGQWLNAYGKTVVAENGGDCLADSLVQNAGIEPSAYEAYPGSLLDNPRFNDLMLSMSPLGTSGVPQTPILFYHSAVDELAPVPEMEKLAARYCSEGLPVQVTLSPAGEHIASVVTDFPIALSYLSARFAGTPPPDGCGASSSGGS